MKCMQKKVVKRKLKLVTDMEKKFINIPVNVQVAGQKIAVEIVEKLGTNLGECCLAQSYIRIAEKYMCNNEEHKQSEVSQEQTFWHELTHCILDAMCESDLSANEKFVSVFSGFLYEAINASGYKIIKD